jgi:hypothetical protein
MKPRTCKNCCTVIPLDTGFYYDKDLNLICGTCGEIACPTKEETTTATTNNKNLAKSMHQHGGFLG